jgi:hypothetical protein
VLGIMVMPIRIGAHGIGFLLDAVGRAASGAQPIRPDNREQDSGLAQHVIDMDAKIDARRDIVDIAEDRFPAIMGGEPVEDSARHRLGIRTAVGNGDLGHQSRSCRVSNILTSELSRRGRRTGVRGKPIACPDTRRGETPKTSLPASAPG